MPALIRLKLPAPEYATLTFPAYRHLLNGGDAVAIGARVGGTPAGLALASVCREESRAELLSIAVRRSERRRGIGALLLSQLESELAREASRCEVVFSDATSCCEILKHMLVKHGWGPIQARMMMCYADLDSILAAPWMRSWAVPIGCSIFPWTDLTSDERSDLQHRRRFSYPAILDPFRESSPCDPRGSVGLRLDGSLAGWVITHVVSPEILRFTSMYVTSDLEKRGHAAISLLAASIDVYRRAPREQVPATTMFNIHVDNKPMMRFARRRLLPYMRAVRHSYSAGKSLSHATNLGASA